MKKIRVSLGFAVLTASLLMPALAANAATWYVNNDPAIVTRDGTSAVTAFATLGAAISAASAGDTITVAKGTAIYGESVTVNKALTITTDTPADPPTLRATEGTSNVFIMVVAADNVTIDGLKFDVYYSDSTAPVLHTRAAITNYPPSSVTGGTWFSPSNSNTFNNLLIQNCTFVYTLEDPSYTPAASRPAGTVNFSFRRNAIGLSGNGSNAAGDDATIRANQILYGTTTQGNPGVSDFYACSFSHGVALFDISAGSNILVGGPTPADGNTINVFDEGGVWSGNSLSGTITVQNNTFGGGTGTWSSGGSSGTVQYISNTFNPVSTNYGYASVVNTMGSTTTVLFSGNTYNVPSNLSFPGSVTLTPVAGGTSSYIPPVPAGASLVGVVRMGAIALGGVGKNGGNRPTVTGNTFQTAAGSADVQYILLDTKENSSGTEAGNQGAIITGNTFKSPSVAGGTSIGVLLQTTQQVAGGAESNYGAGRVQIGGAGPLANTFEALTTYIKLDGSTPLNFFGQPSLATTVNIDGSENLYTVSGGAKRPSAMTDAELIELEGKTDHKVDSTALGYVRPFLGEVRLSPAANITGLIAAAADGDTIRFSAGTFTLPSSLAISTNATLVGAGVSSTTLAPSTSGIGTGITLASANKTFSVADLTIQNFATGINLGTGTGGRAATISNVRFSGNGTSISTGAGNAVSVTRNWFTSTGTQAVLATAQPTSLTIAGNLFWGDAVYGIPGNQATPFNSPAPSVFNNWFASSFDRDQDGNGVIDGLSKVVSAPGGVQTVTDDAVVAQFDQDADGIPNAHEIVINDAAPLVPGGAIAARSLPGSGLTTDADNDGYVDWYEARLLTSTSSAASKPGLGDVVVNGSVNLSDAIKALQIVNGGSTANSNVNAINVTGANDSYTLANPLQILRFQVGVRSRFPAIPGIN